jgi:hypothetical protein
VPEERSADFMMSSDSTHPDACGAKNHQQQQQQHQQQNNIKAANTQFKPHRFAWV